MRKWFVLLAATSLVLGAAGVAGAAPLNWEGTTTVIIADIPPFGFSGGGVATVNSSAGGIPAHLNTLRLKGSRGQMSGTDTQFITDPDTAGNGIAAVILQGAGGTGTFAPISGGASSGTTLSKNSVPIYGMAKICLLSTSCTLYLDMPFTQPTVTPNGGTGTNISAVGIGGLLTAGGYGGIRISLQAAPWTIKTATVSDQITTGGSRVFTQQTVKGWAHGPLSNTTSTAALSGVVQLVTPGQIVSNIPLGSNDKLSAFVIMVVQFIPEPGLLLLLGSGVVGLALLGWRRRR